MSTLARISASLARWELRLAALMLAIVFLLLLLNILTRSIGQAQYWIDESAILAMVWATFFAASAGMHFRSNIAMTLLQDAVPESTRLGMQLGVDLLMLGFATALLILVWRWFDLPGLAAHNWDLTRFSTSTFNFIYEEPTQTLALRKFWTWLILPVFSMTSMLHCLACIQSSTAALLSNIVKARETGAGVGG